MQNDEGDEVGAGESKDTTRERFPFTGAGAAVPRRPDAMRDSIAQQIEGTRTGDLHTGVDAVETDPVVEGFNAVRSNITHVAANLKAIKEHHARKPMALSEDRGEVMANLTLAYRALEDASMRMGKAIQARDGGVSVYDRATTVGA